MVCYSTADCLQFKNQKCKFAEPVLSLGKKMNGGLHPHRLFVNHTQSRKQAISNRLLLQSFRFVTRSTPTATKLCEHDHKKVGELSLRDHRPIWSQNTGNRKGKEKRVSWTLATKSTQCASLWGIGRNPSVERLNSHHSSSQRKKNESNRSQNSESRLEREGREQEHKEHKRDSQKHLTIESRRTQGG
jgi:hypothetical protein